MISRNEVVKRTAKEVVWWLSERKKKLRETLGETMSLNPFLAPALYEFHCLNNLDELLRLLVSAHLITGHSTGFGKLVDEKLLPNVFNTIKLDSKFRKTHSPFSKSCFDEIDHLVNPSSPRPNLLSLKASRWTIQLSMAVQLNSSFAEILKHHGAQFEQIAVGVYYGDTANLTDKYDIVRGINRGANHSVVDLTNKVSVYTGKEFWSWINGGAEETQDWVLEGILKGIDTAQPREETEMLLERFSNVIQTKFSKHSTSSGIDWKSLLNSINK
jgi:hypothetical protein